MTMHERLFADVFDESHQRFREEVLRFVKAEITPHVFAWEEAESFPRELYGKAGAAGILGPTFPVELGGGGGDPLHSVVAAEALVTAGSGGVSAGLGSLEIALPPLLHLGTDEQKARWIPPVLRGERVAALAITEPGTGSDVAGVRTKAVRDGDAYVISGAKTFITSGARADLLTVLARTGPDAHQGLTFFVVERGMPGFSVTRTLQKTGWRASDTAELAFEDVRVPIANRIGGEGSGFLALMRNFENERLMLAAQGCGIAAVAFDEALAWSRQREAFGKPIGRFQVTKHKLAEMLTKVMSARALTYKVAQRMKAGDSVLAEVAMAKNHAAVVANEVCYDAVQIFGGMGYMRESVVERLSRDARLLPIGGGTHEIMNEIVARTLGL